MFWTKEKFWDMPAVSEDDWRHFFAKNDDADRAVPIALAKQLEFTCLQELRKPTVKEPVELARIQGMLIALNSFVARYRYEVMKALGGEDKTAAGGV